MLGLERNGQLLFWSDLFGGAAEGAWRYILPVHVANLGALPAQVGLVLSTSSLAMLLGLLPAGYLADRIERRSALRTLGDTRPRGAEEELAAQPSPSASAARGRAGGTRRGRPGRGRVARRGKHAG